MPGIIYAVNEQAIKSSAGFVSRTISHLYWYQHTGFADGTDHWRTAGPIDGPLKPGGTGVSTVFTVEGWADMKHVFSGDGGVIYAVNQQNQLVWYRHLGCLDGTDRWQTSPDPKGHIGEGWDMKQVFAGEGGVIYAVNQQDHLLWYRHLGFADGTDRWRTSPDPKGYIGEGWGSKFVFHFRPSLQAAQAAIDAAYRRHNGAYGRLGPVSGPVVLNVDGSFTQDHALGKITILDATPTATAQATVSDYYNVNLDLQAIKCFGTMANWPDDTDALYAIVSLVPYGISTTADKNLAVPVTVRTPIVDTKKGDVVLQNIHVGTATACGNGVYIYISLWQHKSGDPNKIRDQIHQGLNDLVNQASDVALSLAGDPATTGGSVGDITNQKVAGVTINDLTAHLADAITNAFFADRLIATHFYNIYLNNVIDLSDQTKVTASEYTDPDIAPDIRVNWPPAPNQNPLLQKGTGGSYKAYFLVTTTHIQATTPTP